jgi:quercetin dioxygenase-like cupin family protein
MGLVWAPGDSIKQRGIHVLPPGIKLSVPFSPRRNMASDPEQAESLAARSPQRSWGPMLTVKWQSELERLLRDNTGENGRLSKTIVKYPNFSVVLMVMKSKATFPEHRSAGRISVQVLKGHIQMHVLGNLVDLPAGHLVALDREVLHDVEALDDSAFMLTIVLE